MPIVVGTGFLDFGAGVWFLCLRAGVGVPLLGFGARLCVGLGKDYAVNILSSCCLDIFL